MPPAQLHHHPAQLLSWFLLFGRLALEAQCTANGAGLQAQSISASQIGMGRTNVRLDAASGFYRT